MKRIFSCSSSQVAVERWTKQDQKLLEAVEKGDVGRVAVLAARRAARPTKLNAAGQSAFHLAASKGLTECLTVLLAHGAAVNERNEDGSTALHLATIACQPQCVKVLLQHGANESHVDGQNRTPLHWAASSGCASSVLLLCDHEAILDVPDAHGQTPLMLAARGDHSAICAQLLRRGANPHLSDSHNRTALALAQERCSVECAELLLRHGAAAGDTSDTAQRPLPRLLRRIRHENGVSSAENTAPESQAEGTPGSNSEEEDEEKEEGKEEEEEEEEEKEEEEDGCDAQHMQHLQEHLARKQQECAHLTAAANHTRQCLRDLVRRLPGGEAAAAEDEDGACLALLAQHVQELRERKATEDDGDGEHQTAAQLGGDGSTPAVAAFLAWLRDECAGMRAAKANAFTRSKALRREVEEALRSKLHYEVVSADAVRRSLAAWEKLVVGLEQTLSRADETHAKMLERSGVLLAGMEPSRCPVNGSEAAPGGKSQEELPAGVSLEKEVVELKESNGMLVAELARLGRERERLQEELRRLRAQDGAAESMPENAGMGALARAREEVSRLRRRLAGQRRELAALRDGLGERAREAGGDAAVLRELHRKLDGLVRSQHEALQLVAEMEGDDTPGDGDALLGELDGALGELVEELGTAPGPRVPRLLRRLMGIAKALHGREQPEQPREQAAAEAERWRAAAEEERRAKEVAEAQVAEREQEVRELREKAEELERSVGSLRARARELATACRDKDGTMKKLLVETEKLSSEVLVLRSQSARLQLQLEVQQKNHREVIGVYRTHLLNAAQGLMDEGVHALLLRLLRTER
ncbi:ankyrin repeat domain-containing protein 35 [Cuculus canorus]|uniref:ankyrin repeat domain-containing protein 35 n=1 Tax=Cuculus canorus TaxID=55661 RepID=UPI0023AB0846|nr:ankyrin repeat domain-containing protein 35 [Cuculus canorus]